MSLIDRIDGLIAKIEEGYRRSPKSVITLCQELALLVRSLPNTQPSFQDTVGRAKLLQGAVVARGEERYIDAIPLLEEALALLRTTNNISKQVLALSELAQCQAVLGYPSMAVEYNYEAIEIATELQDHEALYATYYSLGNNYFVLADFAFAYDNHFKVLELSREYGDKYYECLSLSSLGNILNELQRYEEGIAYVLRGIAISQDFGFPTVTLYSYRYLINLYRRNGQFDRALEHGKLALDLAKAPTIRSSDTVDILVELATVYYDLKQFDIALDRLQEAELLSSRTESRAHEMYMHNVFTNVYEAIGNYELAYHYLRRYNASVERRQGQTEQIKLRLLEVRHATERAENEMEIHQLHNAELASKNDLLQSLVQEKDQILNIISHDLKNPLTTIQLVCDFLLHPGIDLTEPKNRERLKRIRIAAARMTTIISSLLEMQWAEQGLGSVTLEPLSLAPLITEIVGNYTIHADQKQINLVLKIEDRDLIANANRDLLYQVVDNLLSNAIKFSSSDSTITIAVQMLDEYVEISVSDQGQGLSEEDMLQLFTKFSKLSARPSGNESSTGLGLFIVKQLVEAMNGTVTAKSKGKNHGSKFTVRLDANPKLTENVA